MTRSTSPAWPLVRDSAPPDGQLLLNRADALPDSGPAVSGTHPAEAEQEAVAGHGDPDSGNNAQHAAGSTAIALNTEPGSSVAAALSPAPAMLQSHLVAVAAQMPTLRQPPITSHLPCTPNRHPDFMAGQPDPVPLGLVDVISN